MRNIWKTLGVSTVLAVVALGSASGCRHSRTRAHDGALESTARAETKLSSEQLADVRIAFAGSLEKRGELTQALAAYEEAVRADPRRSDAHIRQGAILSQLGRFDEAGACFQKALQLRPKNADLFCDMGYCQFLQGKYDDAQMNLCQAVALQPGHERAHNNLGLVLAHQKRWDEALAQFVQAGCDESDARSNLAFVMALHGEIDNAVQVYRAAQSINPKSAAAQQGLQDLEALAKRGSQSKVVGTPVSAQVPQ